jgi:hypothetical protein
MPAVGGAPWDDLRVLLKGISNVAVSGAFGQAFSRIYAQQFSSVAVFPGGLTAKRGSRTAWAKALEERTAGRRFTFVDDSLYSGGDLR